MTPSTKQKLTFEEYLDYDDGTDFRYELVRGKLQRMNPPTLLHIKIAKYLERLFDSEIQRLQLPWEAFREVGQRTEEATSRLPDIAIVSTAQANELLYKSAVFQVPAFLVVEIVSPSSISEDYQNKLAEYQNLGISEYWIVDPESKKDQRVTVYRLVDKIYQKQEFRGNERILSAVFPELQLTVEQILTAQF
jgi:Uma2 family endonuclease